LLPVLPARFAVLFTTFKLIAMNRFLLTTTFLLAGIFCMAQQRPTPASNTQGVLSEGARLLFSQPGSKLTTSEKNAVFRMLGLQVRPDKKGFRMDGFDVGAKAYPVDMNKDGVEEVFVVMDGLLFGNTGEGVALFMKNSAGVYVQQEEIAGGIAVILDTKTGGYPDLVIAGPGFDFPLYKWNGKSYGYVGTISDDALQNARTSTVEEFWRKTRD
jgi:hypothetical protein